MATARQVMNSIKPKKTEPFNSETPKGEAGYDNPREDIEKTKSLREGTVEKVPSVDNDIANKKYVDDQIALIPGGGDVTAAIALTDETIVQGDGGVKGVKTSTATVAQVASNVAHVAGDGSDHADVATNTAAGHTEAHTVASHSDTTATGAEVEDLTDDSMCDALHRHSELSASDGAPNAAMVVSATGIVTTTEDQASADTPYVPMVLYNTDAVPPAAGGFPIGTLYVQYTA